MSVTLLERPAPTAELGRRGFLLGGAGLLIAGGCGTNSTGEPAAAPTSHQVQTDKGPVTVPASPSKVVCADYYGAFALVDLGLTPVGVGGGGYEGTGSFYGDKLKGVPVIGDYTEPDVEKIAAANPDLILRTIDTPDALYQQLSQIAPTVVISFQKLALLEVVDRVGAVLGRTSEAATVLDSYREKTAAVKAKHAAALAKYAFSFVQVASDTTFWTLGPKWTDTTVLLDCGVQLAEPSKAQAEPTAEYSFEKIGVLAGSGALLLPAAPDGVTVAPDSAPLIGSPVWKNLPAVRAGHVFAVVSGASSLGTGIQLADRMDAVLTQLATA